MWNLLLRSVGNPSYCLSVRSFFFLLLIHSQYLHLIYPTTLRGYSKGNGIKSQYKFLYVHNQ